jgi:hypothetical protein
MNLSLSEATVFVKAKNHSSGLNFSFLWLCFSATMFMKIACTFLLNYYHVFLCVSCQFSRVFVFVFIFQLFIFVSLAFILNTTALISNYFACNTCILMNLILHLLKNKTCSHVIYPRLFTRDTRPATCSYVNVNWYVILSEHTTSRPPCINNEDTYLPSQGFELGIELGIRARNRAGIRARNSSSDSSKVKLVKKDFTNFLFGVSI